MPEFAEAQKAFEELGLTYQTEFSKLQAELENKVLEYRQNLSSYDDAIKEVKESEIRNLQERMQAFGATSEESLQRKQMELMQPIEEKINKAIKEVGEENKFTYIFEIQSQALAYYSSQSIDVTPLVKKKFNIK